jgi:hypothetical protein
LDMSCCLHLFYVHQLLYIRQKDLRYAATIHTHHQSIVRLLHNLHQVVVSCSLQCVV